MSTGQDPWPIVLAAARHIEAAARRGASCVLDRRGELGDDAGPNAVLRWLPEEGWVSLLPPDDPRAPLIDLYLPICAASGDRPVVVGHLGQSLDGFIATSHGESRWVTGPENLLHLHRLRALCDAVVVGGRTVAADDPRLTTRRVEGSNPLRVVLDPDRRLSAAYAVFTDDEAPTVYACRRSAVPAGETRRGNAPVLLLDPDANGSYAAPLVQALLERGCRRILVEGGGVTVSRFLEARQLTRLHLTIAPVLIGEGRPGIRLTPSPTLGESRRPAYRVFRMGGDVLFDCDLAGTAGPDPADGGGASVSRVI